MQTPQRGPWRSTATLLCASFFPGHGESLSHVARLIDEYAIEQLDERELMTACEFGASPSDLDFVLSRTTPDWSEVVKAASKGGHLHVFQWMRERQDDRGPWEADFSHALTEAARNDHLELVKWLHERGLGCIREMAFIELARDGHLAVLKWLLERNTDNVTFGVDEAMCGAAGGGDLATVQWIYDHFKETVNVGPAMTSAARKGDLDMLQWLHQQTSCSETCTTYVMDAAVGGGHLDVVEWLFENCNAGCSKSASGLAAGAGNLLMLQWLHQHYRDRFESDLMNLAAMEGHLEVVKWLHDLGSLRCTSIAMDAAAGKGHLEVVRWLHENRTEGCTTQAMDDAARSGNLGIVKWLHENRAEGCTESAVRGAAYYGFVDVLLWLVEHYPDQYVQCRDDVMEIAAWGGHLDIVRYLDENTSQRASAWGLGAAAKQGWLKTLLVLLQNYYQRHNNKTVGYGAVLGAFHKILFQMASEHATPASLLWAEALELLETCRSCGSLCVLPMLDLALRRGFLLLVQQFMGHRDADEKRDYAARAAWDSNFVLLRWLLRNGTPIGMRSIILLAGERSRVQYFEVVGYLSEGDRVRLVREAAAGKRHKLLRWTLQNCRFNEENSRATIGKAIRKAPSDTVQWLRENLTNPEARKWCIPSRKRQRVE